MQDGRYFESLSGRAIGLTCNITFIVSLKKELSKFFMLPTMIMRNIILLFAVVVGTATGFASTKHTVVPFARKSKKIDHLLMAKVSTNNIEATKSSPVTTFSDINNTELWKVLYDGPEDGHQAANRQLDTVFKSMPQELYSLAVAKNRPKKESVSFHSTLTRSTTMAVLVTLIPLFAPGVGNDGQFQLFQYNEHISSEIVTQSQFCAVLQLVGAMLGILRLPKNSPPVRELGMKQGAYFVAVLSLIAISNLNGTDQYLFDAFSMPGRVLFATMATLVTKISIQFIDCSIADKTRRGFHVGGPLMGHRLTAAFQAIAVYSMGFLVIQGCTPLFMEQAAFEELVKPYYTDIYNGALTSATVAVNQWIGLGALVGTLQFEKKMTMLAASLWYIVLGLFLAFDSFKLAYDFSAHQIYSIPEAQNQLLFQHNLAAQWHTTEVYFGLMGIAILNSLRKVLMDSDDSEDTEITSGARNNAMARKGTTEPVTLLAPVPVTVVSNATSIGL